MERQRIAYVIADSSHGRIVMWDARAHGFRTRLAVQSGPTPRTRFSTKRQAQGRPLRDEGPAGDRMGLRKRMRAEFAAVLIDRICAFTREIPVEGIVLAAPARFLTLLRDGLPGNLPVLGVVAENLTGAPDHELAGRLSHVEPRGGA